MGVACHVIISHMTFYSNMAFNDSAEASPLMIRDKQKKKPR